MILGLQTRLKRLARETSGQEVAEAALVLPIAFLILLGIFWFGRAYNVYATVTHAAAEGARVAATPTCATCTNVPQSDAAVFAEISSILQASKLDINQIRAYSPPAYATLPAGCDALYNNVLICRGVLLNNPTTAQACTTAATNPPAACGTMVSFRYRFSFPFTTNFQLIQIPAAAEARVEN
jgi:Flp pilus assembly protein TadG